MNNSPESIYDLYKLKNGVTEKLYWAKIVRSRNPNTIYFI